MASRADEYRRRAQGPLTPELVQRHAKVDRGYVTPEELDKRLQVERDEAFEAKRAEIQKMVDDAMRKSVAELIAPKKDDAA